MSVSLPTCQLPSYFSKPITREQFQTQSAFFHNFHGKEQSPTITSSRCNSRAATPPAPKETNSSFLFVWANPEALGNPIDYMPHYPERGQSRLQARFLFLTHEYWAKRTCKPKKIAWRSGSVYLPPERRMESIMTVNESVNIGTSTAISTTQRPPPRLN